MRTAEERESFIQTFRISITWSNDEVSLYWRGRDSPGKPGGYHPIAKGETLTQAIERAIERWERKHKKRWEPGIKE
jgi:hypothetical protein